jgi:hypothetical protein
MTFCWVSLYDIDWCAHMYTTSQVKKVRRGATVNQHPPGHPFHARYYAVVDQPFIFGVKFRIVVIQIFKIILKEIQSFFEEKNVKIQKKTFKKSF